MKILTIILNKCVISPAKSSKRECQFEDLYYGGENEFFDYDKVVLATHADEALNLIENPTEDEKNILSNFSYKENIAYIHTDQRAMPKNKKYQLSQLFMT